MNTRSSLRASSCVVEEKSHLPIHGMSLRIGMPLSLSFVVVWVRPPKMTVMLFSRTASADILRVTVVAWLSPSTIWPAPSCEYSSSTVSITVPFGLIFGVTLILMPRSFCS